MDFGLSNGLLGRIQRQCSHRRRSDVCRLHRAWRHPLSDVNRVASSSRQAVNAVVIAGDLEAILGGNSRLAILPGQLVGVVSAYSDLAVVARGPGILAKWDLRHVR